MFSESKKKIVAVDVGFGQANLGGCSDWNCELSSSRDTSSADVLIMQSARSLERKPHQLVVYYSQVSRVPKYVMDTTVCCFRNLLETPLLSVAQMNFST